MREKPKYLTVCLANAARSPTAEWLLKIPANQVRSCGVSSSAIEPCEKNNVNWADKIFVMEQYMKDDLLARFPTIAKKVEVLGVPEIGEYTCDPKLIHKINSKLKKKGAKTRLLSNDRRNEYECAKWFGQSMARKSKRRGSYHPVAHVASYLAEWARLHPPEPTYEGSYVPKYHIREGAKRIAEAQAKEDQVARLFKKKRR